MIKRNIFALHYQVGSVYKEKKLYKYLNCYDVNFDCYILICSVIIYIL